MLASRSQAHVHFFFPIETVLEFYANLRAFSHWMHIELTNVHNLHDSPSFISQLYRFYEFHMPNPPQQAHTLCSTRQEKHGGLTDAPKAGFLFIMPKQFHVAKTCKWREWMHCLIYENTMANFCGKSDRKTRSKLMIKRGMEVSFIRRSMNSSMRQQQTTTARKDYNLRNAISSSFSTASSNWS